MTAPLGVGLIGCGNISTAYLRLAPLFQGFEIKAVADLNFDLAKQKAIEFDVRAQTVDALLAAEDIAIIVNLTIPAAHFEVSSKALNHGKHVYSEKPVVLTLEEGQKLADLAASKGLRVGSAPDTFLGGSHQTARALIDAGKIGQITSGTAHIMGRGMEHWHPNPDFFFQPGAGPIFDMGVYYLTNLVQLLGPIARVAAISATPADTRTIGSGPRSGETVPVETPTTLHALLGFASGATITLGASWDVAAHGHAPMELYGSDGTLFVPDPNAFGGDLRMETATGKSPHLITSDHPLAIQNEHFADGTPVANYRGVGLADMVAALREDRPHRCGLDLALHVVETMEAILTSAETGQFVPLTTTVTQPAPLDAAEATMLLAEVT